jgi:hypothetical protein
MNPRLNVMIVVLVSAGLLLVGCSGLTSQSSGQPASNQSNLSNGEQIYFTGIDQKEQRITYTGGPNFGGMMMGSCLTCAACHVPTNGWHLQVISQGIQPISIIQTICL